MHSTLFCLHRSSIQTVFICTRERRKSKLKEELDLFQDLRIHYSLKIIRWSTFGSSFMYKRQNNLMISWQFLHATCKPVISGVPNQLEILFFFQSMVMYERKLLFGMSLVKCHIFHENVSPPTLCPQELKNYASLVYIFLYVCFSCMSHELSDEFHVLKLFGQSLKTLLLICFKRLIRRLLSKRFRGIFIISPLFSVLEICRDFCILQL